MSPNHCVSAEELTRLRREAWISLLIAARRLAVASDMYQQSIAIKEILRCHSRLEGLGVTMADSVEHMTPQ